MNVEIKKQDWTNFFETLSRRRYEWKTKIEVLKTEIGGQVLTEGLPLNGITVESAGDRTSIEISVGENTEAHQTHTVSNPSTIFLRAEENRADVVDIEEEDGTKTLITFIEPMGIWVEHAEVNIAASV